jgi:hypothetical protein
VSLLKLRQESSDFDSFIEFIGLGDVIEAQRDPSRGFRDYLQYTLNSAQTELLYKSVEELIYAQRNLRMLKINQRQYLPSKIDDLRSSQLHKMPVGWYILIPSSIDRKNKIERLAKTGVEIQLKDVTFGGLFYKRPDLQLHTTVSFLYNGRNESILVNPFQLLDYDDIVYGSVFINPIFMQNPSKEFVVFPLIDSKGLTLNYPNSFI